MNFDQAKKHHTHEIVRSLCEGGGTLVEADRRVNNSALKAIEALAEKHGQVWLGKINRYSEDKDKPYIWKWDGSQILNFSSDFAIPEYDRELEKLLREWEQQVSVKLIETIQDHVSDKLGGVMLLWS